MNVTVAGLWHLGCVTAACCARHFQVTGLEFDPSAIDQLNQGRAPLLEPGLDDLLGEGLKAGRLRFTHDPQNACARADVLWLAYDTPVDDEDRSDTAFVLERLRRCLAHLPEGRLVVVSSQLPAGTCRELENEFPRHRFACVPENLRLGRALEAFAKADRFVAGIRNDADKAALETLLQPFTGRILFMRTESAEMVKHALNSFLAASVTFINEIARLCEGVGADARDVAAGLKSDARIGPKAYLGPGGPFAGGTLARDVVTLTQLAEKLGDPMTLIPAIKQSNDRHRGWIFRRLERRLGELRGKTVAVLGLTYTPNTDTLRRSAAVELCQRLLDAGASVRAYDPAVQALPEKHARITLCRDAATALSQADAVAVCTEWSEFRALDWPKLAGTLRQPVIVDANGFLQKELNSLPQVEHLCVGRGS